MSKLTDKQEKFCNEYLIDLNATQAAIRAGYSENTAKEIGCENLAKPNIQERIQELQKELRDKTDVTPEKIVKELANIAFSNIADVLDVCIKGIDTTLTDEELLTAVSGTWVSFKDGVELKELPRVASSLISEIKETKDGVSVKLYDKLNAMDKLMKHLGMFEKDNKQQEGAKSQITIFKIPDNGRG